jgi:nicotinamidase-related amidase
MQTALGLRERGYEPFLVEDAIGSQRAEDRAAAMQRLAAAGCSAATTEMAIFEWLHRADDARFREALQVVKGL